MLTLEEMRELEREACRKDPVYFCETYCHIEDKDADELIQPFTLWDGQKKALTAFAGNRLVCVLKARQLGFTWLALVEVARLVALNTGRTAIGLSRSEDEAKELVRRLAVILRYMPGLIREVDTPGGSVAGWTGPVFYKSTMQVVVMWPDGPESVFKAFPSSPAAGRSFTADLIVIDEWAFQQYAEEIWQAAYPVINRPFGGRVIGLSTIKLGTLFEEIYTNPGNGFTKLFLPWSTDPRRTEKWYAQTVAALGEDKTMQEYPATEEEALSAPGGRFFSELDKDTHLVDAPPTGPLRRYVAIDYGLDMLAAIWIAVDQNNHATVYRVDGGPNKTIGEAADLILRDSEGEEIDMYLAPPDLWNRSQESGKSRAQLFSEAHLPLVQSSRDFPAGCAAMKQWLRKDEKTGKGYLTFYKPGELWTCLAKIQKDDKNADVYAKNPHGLTHFPDALRYFCVWWTSPAKKPVNIRKRKWSADMYEDYRNANAEERKMLMERWGHPA